MGAGACPAFTIRRQVLLDTGTMRGVSAGILNRPQFAGGSKVSIDGAYGKK